MRVLSAAAAALTLLVGIGGVRDDYWRGEDIAFVVAINVALVVMRHFLDDEDVDDAVPRPTVGRRVALPALWAGFLAALNPLANELGLEPDSLDRVVFFVAAFFVSLGLLSAWDRWRG